MPTWPGDLPQVVSTESYREVPPWPTVEVPMDAGSPKTFGSGTDDGRAFTCKIDLDRDQRESLDTFYRVDLRHGTAEFDGLTLRDAGVTKLGFLTKPSYVHVDGDIFAATLTLESRAEGKQTGFRCRSKSTVRADIRVGVTTGFACASGSHVDFDNT